MQEVGYEGQTMNWMQHGVEEWKRKKKNEKERKRISQRKKKKKEWRRVVGIVGAVE